MADSIGAAARWRVGDPDPTPDLGWNLIAYCWAPRRIGTQLSRYCSWSDGHAGEHIAVGQGSPGSLVITAVWSSSDPPAGRVWSPRDTKPFVYGPEDWAKVTGQPEDRWTDAMVLAGRDLGVNRQCSIGWHYECSDPAGDRCRCACHADHREDSA